MAKEILHIKNMVCPRCITSVEDILQALHLSVEKVELGTVLLNQTISSSQISILKNTLQKQGFDLLQDKKDKLVEAVKTHVIQLIKNPSIAPVTKLSTYLSRELGYDYSHISSIFTASQNITIEKYVILQKIEYVKELLSYNELSLSEIADKLHYSSVAALSAQFKNSTGTTPSAFKSANNQQRKSLDNIIP